MGLQNSSKAISHKFADYYLSAFYHEKPDDVRVIVFTDNYKEKWPPSAADYSELVNLLALAKPKSIFFDFKFLKKTAPNSYQQLNKSFNRAISNGIKIYITEESEKSLNNPSLEVVQITWDGFETYYPASFANIPTPAFSIYQSDKSTESGTLNAPMYVRWPLLEHIHGSVFRKVWSGFKYMFHNAESDKFKLSQYIESYDFLDLIYMPERQLLDIFQDKHVMIGTSISYLNDEIKTNLYGTAPGIFLHAMALDNLTKFNENYYKQSKKVNWLGFEVGSFIEMFVLLVNLGLFGFYNYLKDERNSLTGRRYIRRNTKYAFIGLLISIPIITTGFYLTTAVFRIEPANFIGLFSLNFFVYEFCAMFLLCIASFTPLIKYLDKS